MPLFYHKYVNYVLAHSVNYVITLYIPVIAVGVPTTMEYESDNDRFFVTRYDIDVEISRYAHIISCALNRSLCPSLSYSDISMLMNYS